MMALIVEIRLYPVSSLYLLLICLTLAAVVISPPSSCNAELAIYTTSPPIEIIPNRPVVSIVDDPRFWMELVVVNPNLCIPSCSDGVPLQVICDGSVTSPPLGERVALFY